ncbi:MAG TPA: hypothetical protein VKK31_20085 [Thermoanaerobaculia bacterium]|nr:hypothetical protein [Thermoanaerobaculia bacterium]
MEQNEGGPLAKFFAAVGVFAGAALGAEAGDFMALCIGAIILGLIGFGIGRVVENLLIRLIFIIVSIIFILINSAIRRFIWELIRAAANG